MPEVNNTATEQDTNTQVQAATGAKNNDGNAVIDYDKIQSMIDKGVQQKENAILKSYFEQQGMSEDEVKAAIGDWKSKKQTQAKEQTDSINQLTENNKALQARLTQELLNRQAFNDCLDLGVDRATIPHVIKCAEFNDCLDDKGEVKADKVRETIEKVLADVPAFKGTAKDDKGFKVGVGGEQEDATEQENALRKAFGLAPKK